MSTGAALLPPPPWRACDLCHHGATVGAERVCNCRAVAAPRAWVPVEMARHHGGPCGPEAQHLDIPSHRH